MYKKHPVVQFVILIACNNHVHVYNNLHNYADYVTSKWINGQMKHIFYTL